MRKCQLKKKLFPQYFYIKSNLYQTRTYNSKIMIKSYFWPNIQNYQIKDYKFYQIHQREISIRNMEHLWRLCRIFYPLSVNFVEELNGICLSQLFGDSFLYNSLFIYQDCFNTQMPSFLAQNLIFLILFTYFLQFLRMSIQDVLGELLGGDYQEPYNYNGYQGFNIDYNSQSIDPKATRPTVESPDNISHSNQSEESVKQAFKIKVPQNQILLPPRKKNYIVVSSQKRNKYLKTRKGTNQQTNDLSIHVCTLVKSYFKEYLTFEKVQAEDERKLKIFQQSSLNMNSLKQLLIPDTQKLNQSKFYEQDEQNEEKGKKIDKFLSEKLEQPGTIKQILLKRKMRFENKLILLKYLSSVKNIVENPQQFKSWKNSRLSY